MSRIFVSHASADNADACALGEWLNEAGFEQQFFLDFDLRRGIAAGEVWPQAIMRALERCEVVLCLLSPAWARSDWCRIEFEKGKDFGKSLLFAVIDANGYDGLLTHIRSTYQVVHLHGGGAQRTILSRLPKTLREIEVSFDADALERLRIGLKKAGLSPDGFPLTDRDRLYPGLRALDTQDAAVFFARDAEIVRTMGMLRSMRRQARARVLVVFAASGAGKSSLLRAGLWPRLRRAEREFLVLPVLRPGDAALSGEEGLIACLHACALREGAPPEWSRERCRQWLTSEGLTAPLERLRKMAASRLAAISDDDGDPEPPMPMLMIDQGEELFSEQAGVEGRQLLALMTDALRLDAMMVVICLRPEACERWQNLSGMDGVEQRFYLLPKISQALVKDIIEGPAQRDRDTNGRDGLRIDPLLTERLLQEWSGEDALPLLALTLRRLYDAYGASGRLEMAAYESVGGLGGMLDAAIEQAVDRAIEVGAMPRDPARRQAMVQRTFVPALIAIHPQTQAPLRRIARFDLLPPESQGLVRALLDARLLSESVRQIDGVPRRLVEVAHEALLRQWPALRQAVERELAARARLEGLARTAAAWWESGRNDAALRDGGQSLREIETLLERPDLRASMDEATSTYLAECHAQEARLMLQAQWRTRRKRAMALIRRHAIRGAVLIMTIAILAAYGAWEWRTHSRLKTLLALSRQESESGMHAAALRYALSAARHRSFWSPREIRAANQQLRFLALQPIWTVDELSTEYMIGNSILLAGGAHVAITNAIPHELLSPAGMSSGFKRNYSLTIIDVKTKKELKFFGYDNIEHLRYNKDGNLIAVATTYSNVEIIDTTKNESSVIISHRYGNLFPDNFDFVRNTIISRDGERIILLGADRVFTSKYASLWAISNSDTKGIDANIRRSLHHEDVVELATFSDEGGLLATSSRDGIIKLWHSEDGDFIRSLPIKTQVEHFSFSHDGKKFLVQSPNGQVTLWDTRTGALVSSHQGDKKIQPSFSPDGRQFAMASPKKSLTVRDSASGNQLINIEHQDYINAYEFSNDGKLLATASSDGRILITDLDIKTTAPLASRSESAAEIRFSIDDKKLLVRGWSETVLLDVSKRKILAEMPLGSSIELSYAGNLVLAKTDYTNYLFNISPLSPEARSTIDSANDDILVDTLCRIVSPPAGSANDAPGVPGFYSAHTDAELSWAEVLDPETDRDPCRPATAWQRLEAAVPDWLR